MLNAGVSSSTHGCLHLHARTCSRVDVYISFSLSPPPSLSVCASSSIPFLFCKRFCCHESPFACRMGSEPYCRVYTARSRLRVRGLVMQPSPRALFYRPSKSSFWHRHGARTTTDKNVHTLPSFSVGTRLRVVSPSIVYFSLAWSCFPSL